MDDQNKNLILATALSFLVILIWFFLFPPEEAAPPQPEEAVTSTLPAATDAPSTAPGADPAGTGTGAAPVATETAAEAPRIAVATPSLTGTISLQGGRIDTLSLNDYHETLDPDSPEVELLEPLGSENPYFVLFSWAPGGDLDFADVPGPDTEWQLVQGEALTPETPITLEWQSPAGLTFRRTLTVDDRYMFTVTQSVTNPTDAAVRLAPEARIERIGEPPDLKGFFVLHEGAIRQGNDERDYVKYKAMRDFGTDGTWAYGGNLADAIEVDGTGWIGITDHYWQTVLIPSSGLSYQSVLQYDTDRDTYRAIARMDTLEIAPGGTETTETRVFAGAKEWETIRAYQNDEGIANFLDSIDWGWFFFLTKPIFAVLHWLHSFIGNMGWSIIALTLVLKAVVFPLAYKSYASMAKMKELQPQIEKLKEKVGDDRQKLQQEMMALYKKEKVNPASGCLPVLLQIPIFFSLYKVIFVTLELRHAPWIGWITDLSAPDPSSIINLFGLLPNDAPDPSSVFFILSLGVLPIILGISMWLQQKLNPAPTDATQAMIFAWMPWVFMFMLGRFASGLVLYWITNNTITFTQQYIIMRIHGYKPDVFGNILSSFKRGKKAKEK